MNPLTKFLLDLAEAAVLGAAVAALALPDGLNDPRLALYLIAGGAVGAVKGAARASLSAFVSSRKPAA